MKVSNPRSGLYQARIPLPNPLLANLPIVRGWASVDVKVRGKSFRFVDTHLEAFSAAVRTLQAVELSQLLADAPLPVVLVGDLNSEPTDAAGAYGILTGALGLEDAWVDVHGPAGGNTSGQTDDLNLPESRIDHRIDYVLYQPRALDAVAADVVGDQQAEPDAAAAGSAVRSLALRPRRRGRDAAPGPPLTGPRRTWPGGRPRSSVRRRLR